MIGNEVMKSYTITDLMLLRYTLTGGAVLECERNKRHRERIN